MDDEKVDEKIAAVSAWMKAHGWPVDETHYTSMYLWRSYATKPATTLFITRNCFDDHSPAELPRILEALRVHQLLERAPRMYTIVKNSEHGEPTVEQRDELQKDTIRSTQVNAF